MAWELCKVFQKSCAAKEKQNIEYVRENMSVHLKFWFNYN